MDLSEFLFDHQGELEKQHADYTKWLDDAKKAGVIDNWNDYGSFRIPGSNANDVDFLILWKGSLTDAKKYATGSGWVVSSDEEYEGADKDVWFSARSRDVNFIVTCDVLFYLDGVLASDLCFALGLADKNDRIVLHSMLQDGLDLEAALARRKV